MWEVKYNKTELELLKDIEKAGVKIRKNTKIRKYYKIDSTNKITFSDEKTKEYFMETTNLLKHLSDIKNGRESNKTTKNDTSHLKTAKDILEGKRDGIFALLSDNGKEVQGIVNIRCKKWVVRELVSRLNKELGDTSHETPISKLLKIKDDILEDKEKQKQARTKSIAGAVVFATLIVVSILIKEPVWLELVTVISALIVFIYTTTQREKEQYHKGKVIGMANAGLKVME